MSMVQELEKKNECERLIKNISQGLPKFLSTHLQINLTTQDFLELIKLIQDNFDRLKPHFQGVVLPSDMKVCKKIRNILAHQNKTNIDFLNHAVTVLNACQKAFGITSATVLLRVLACKKCRTVITRTAQPSLNFKDSDGKRHKTARTYDVQSWVVANQRGELAKREGTWYPGWVSTTTYCGTCRMRNIYTNIGLRFDWAPEDRIDLTVTPITYLLDRQAMVVTYPDGSIRDLTHVVSDGEVRRHRYVLYEKELLEVV